MAHEAAALEEAPTEGAEDIPAEVLAADPAASAEVSADDPADFTVHPRRVITDRFSEADGSIVRARADGAAVADASADFSACFCFRSSSLRSLF